MERCASETACLYKWGVVEGYNGWGWTAVGGSFVRRLVKRMRGTQTKLRTTSPEFEMAAAGKHQAFPPNPSEVCVPRILFTYRLQAYRPAGHPALPLRHRTPQQFPNSLQQNSQLLDESEAVEDYNEHQNRHDHGIEQFLEL